MYFGDVTPGQTIATWTGGYLTDGGVWTNNSDAVTKADFEPVNAKEVLAKVAQLPITTWRYRVEEAGIRHLGPVAQDFHAAFGLGADDKHIGTVDAEGVALEAIQGLHQLLQEKEQRIATLEQQANAQQQEMAALRRSIELLLARSSPAFASQ